MDREVNRTMVTNNIDYTKLNNECGYADLTLSNTVDARIDWHTADRNLERADSVASKLAKIKEKERNKEQMNTDIIKITDIEIIKENIVTMVYFSDGNKEKMVCHKDDTFDLRECLFIATAKHLYKDEYTWEGIEYMARQLSYQKQYVKMVDKALKVYGKKLKDLDKLKLNQENATKAIENKKRKHAAYLKRREEKRINLQAQAVLKGLKMYDEAISKDRIQKQDAPDCSNEMSDW